MFTEPNEEISDIKSPDLIDFASPSNFFLTSETVQKADSPDSDVTSALRKEYDGFVKSAMIIPHTNQDATFKSRMMFFSRSLNGQPTSLTNERLKMKDSENSSAKNNFELSKEMPKLVSFVHDDEEMSVKSLSSLRNSKEPEDKQGTDGESSEMSFEFPSIEKFRLMEDHSFMQSSIIDQDLERVESLLDGWTCDLKKKILAEFSQSKIRLLEYYRQQIALVKEKQNIELYQLLQKNDSLKDLVKNFEKSLKTKDEVIENLTTSLKGHQNKMMLQKFFCDWRVKQNNAEKQKFVTNLAQNHYRNALMKKSWRAWHSILEGNWRDQIKTSCQAKAQVVCIELTRDYENKLASMSGSLEQLKRERDRLYEERETCQEEMKKAFMRGVCALNLEAMSVFQERDTTGGSKSFPDDGGTNQNRADGNFYGSQYNLQTLQHHHQDQHHHIYQHEATYFSDPSPPVRKTVASKKPTVLHFPIKNRIKQVKVVPAKNTSHSVTSNLLGTVLSPPMASVVVERHQPISKQTIGQAVACRYPKTSSTNGTTLISSLKKRSSPTSSRLIKVTN